MKDKSLLLQLIGETPLFKIVDFLIENKEIDFSKIDIAKGANISRTSLFEYWNELEKSEIVKVSRKFGKTKLFTLNSKSPVVKRILELEMTLIKQSMEKSQNTKKKILISA